MECISAAYLHRLYSSLPRRGQAVRRARGYLTRYWLKTLKFCVQNATASISYQQQIRGCRYFWSKVTRNSIQCLRCCVLPVHWEDDNFTARGVYMHDNMQVTVLCMYVCVMCVCVCMCACVKRALGKEICEVSLVCYKSVRTTKSTPQWPGTVSVPHAHFSFMST